MKLKDGFLLHTVGSDTYAVATTPELAERASMIRLNGTAEFLWKLLAEERTEEDLVSALLSEYELTEDVARADVRAFCQRLAEAGFLD